MSTRRTASLPDVVIDLQHRRSFPRHVSRAACRERERVGLEGQLPCRIISIVTDVNTSGGMQCHT
jgi:hypothetical protein